MTISGLLLAGGKSSRFGADKLKIRVGPMPLLTDQVMKISFFCKDIVISTSQDSHRQVSGHLKKIDDYYDLVDAKKLFRGKGRFSRPFIQIVQDKHVNQPASRKSRAPILGMYSGLRKIRGDYALILAADMPLVSYRLLEMLAGQAKKNKKDAYIIRTDKGYEALCGLYSAGCLDVLKKNIAAGIYKISDCYSKLDIKTIGPQALQRQGIDSLNFLNINTPQDYQKFQKTWKTCLSDDVSLENLFKRWAYFFFR